ncbi:hypothetical protein [Natranaerobius thermophilus]|uniref:Uncharacterized protein n=1 Tax=Natranaerobius thermophilus (strain ATCC BAA-1301 / DSM 18059 / JW/NM-WN-LF) TaxID=457570 RepID=B2A5T2_NATTJ|nr:hypothetical protein [Natranaerobius thermophilus]ACB84025.1 hypothetical protein Nther_0429 [Natranaerobius thermophilus JW/NM-WN-LF]
MEFLIIGLIVIGIIIYFIRQKSSVTSKENQLRKKCKALLNLPPEEADDTLDRLIERQKEKHPGKSEEWYLDKILYDLEKDK